MIAAHDTIWDVAALAAASLRKFRAGKLRIVQRSGPVGQLVSEIAAPAECEKPCVVRLVKGDCPVCDRPINLRLGHSRRNRVLENAPARIDADAALVGFGMDAAPLSPLRSNWKS